MDWQKFENDIVKIVDETDEATVPMKPYAQTYARNIMVNLEEGRSYNMSDERATRVQLLYIISNLEGAKEESLQKIEKLAADYKIDISDAIKEILNQS